jgi:hypothetical protein
MEHWLSLPEVSAPSGLNRKVMHRYCLSREFVERNASISRNTPILQIWAHIVGQLPPINNISRLASATTDRPFADADKAARRLLEHAHAFEPIQEGRIYIEKLNGPFLFIDKGSPAEYTAGLELAIARG